MFESLIAHFAKQTGMSDLKKDGNNIVGTRNGTRYVFPTFTAIIYAQGSGRWSDFEEKQ